MIFKEITDSVVPSPGEYFNRLPGHISTFDFSTQAVRGANLPAAMRSDSILSTSAQVILFGRMAFICTDLERRLQKRESL